VTKSTKIIIGTGIVGYLAYQIYNSAMALTNLSYWITSVKIYSISLSSMRIDLGLRITNQTSQNLTLQTIDTVFYIDGERAGYLYQSFPDAQTLNKYDSTTITLQCNVSTFSILTKIYSIFVTKSEDWKKVVFAVKGTIKANGIGFPIDKSSPITEIL